MTLVLALEVLKVISPPQPQTVALCSGCPWAIKNHLKEPDPFNSYTEPNVRRLWNEVRSGGFPQSCHMTDPTNPIHLAMGCPSDASMRECAGSLILVARELVLASRDDKLIDIRSARRYIRERPNGLTLDGLWYFAAQRGSFADIPLIGGPPLPEVDIYDERVALPAYLGLERCVPQKG